MAVLRYVARLSSLIILLAAAWGQANYRAEIRGIVTDQTAAVIPNATITITEVGTNLATTAVTDSKGYYSLPGLRPSTYSIKAVAPGFQAFQRTNVVLAVDQQTSINFNLKPAGMA